MSDREDLAAEFELNNVELDAEYELSENQHIDADFVINAAPEKVSQLENDLNFQTGEQVQEAIQAESDVINARIDDEVERLEDEIHDATLDIQGSALIDATKVEQTVTLTSKTYTHEQGIASDTWVIEHDLGKHPNVTAVDSSDRVQLPNEIEYINDNKIIVYFLSAFTGKAYLN